MKGQGDAPFLLFLIFIIILINILLAQYNQALCPQTEEEEFNFTTSFNMTEEGSYEWIKEHKCEGLPNWYYVIFNSPILLVIGLIMKKYVLI